MNILNAVSLFPNVEDKTNISMAVYAQRILESINTYFPSIKVALHGLRSVRYPAMLRNVVEKVPLLRFYAEELFVSRNIMYPFLARKKQSQINHILDHSIGHLIDSMDQYKTVITCHDLQPIVEPCVEYKIKPKWLQWFERSVSRMEKAAKVIVVSQNTKRDLLKYTRVREENIRVIYNGVDKCFRVMCDNSELLRIRKKFGIDNFKGKLVLNVGNIQRRKNIPGIFNTLQRLDAKRHNIKFLHVGQELNDEYKNMATRMGFSDVITDIGRVENSDLVGLYNLSDILLFPSLYEGFGWPVVEAFACGIPVITSNVSSLPEIAGDAALLIDPYNSDEIARAVMKFLSDDELSREYIKKGLVRAKDFSWKNTIEQVISVYEEVLGSNAQ